MVPASEDYQMVFQTPQTRHIHPVLLVNFDQNSCQRKLWKVLNTDFLSNCIYRLVIAPAFPPYEACLTC